MISFEVNNIRTEVFIPTVASEEDKNVRELIREVTSISIHYYTKRKGQRHPEKKVRKVGYYTGRYFPTGLLPRVIRAIKGKIEYKIFDVRHLDAKVYKFPLELPLLPIKNADYSFQERAVDIAYTRQRGLFKYPTGSGKTIIMAKIIQRLGVKSLVVVPNLQLFNQTYEKFCQYFGESIVGKYGEGDSSGLERSRPIVIATQQSLYSMMKKDCGYFNSVVGKQFQALFIDECHHIATNSGFVRDKLGKWVRKENPANSWHAVAMNIDAYYRFGFSATIELDDNSNDQFVLESVTGQVLDTISVSELIERNVLCPIKVTMVKSSAEKCGVWRNIWGRNKESGERELLEYGAYEHNIINNQDRNNLIASVAKQLHKSGKRVLILVDLVEEHGKVIHKLLPNSVFLYGGSNKKERQKQLKKVEEDGSILIGTIFKEGFDMPAMDVLIIAGGGNSSRSLLQKIGRVLRVSRGKDYAIVVDFYDQDESMCERHSESRLKVYQSEPMYKVEVIDCEQFKV